MKITKQQLTKIIKEELEGAMNEIDATAELLAAMRDKLVQLSLKVSSDVKEVVNELIDMIDMWEEEQL